MKVRHVGGSVLATFLFSVVISGVVTGTDWNIVSPVENTEFADTADFTSSGMAPGGGQSSVIVTFCRHSGVVECERDAQVGEEDEWLIDGTNKFDPAPTWSIDAGEERHKLKLYDSAIPTLVVDSHTIHVVD